MTDVEFCELLPDDLFCERFFDPDAVGGLDASDASSVDPTPDPGLIPIDGGGSARILPPTDSDDSPVLAGSDLSRRRSDGMCLPGDPFDEDDVDYDVAYQVVNGQLGYVCHGIPDHDVEVAWATLVEMTPPTHLTELAVFAGFFDNSSMSRQAFVRPITSAVDTEFLLAVNLVTLDNDEHTAFAIAHEIGHVLTLRSERLEAPVPPFACETFHGRSGCHREGSILDRWVDEFWDGDWPADPDDRCDADPGLLTSYAATAPSEDFADSFAAAVVGFRPENSGQEARLAFMHDDPELVEFVERGRAAGYEPPRFLLGLCG